MLVLTRKASEQIQIGDQVIITVLQVKGQSVRIGIEAPREVRVLRAELPKHETAPDQNSATTSDQQTLTRSTTLSLRTGLSSTRKITPRRSTTSTRRGPDRTRPGSDTRRHPDRARSLAHRPSFLNHL